MPEVREALLALFAIVATYSLTYVILLFGMTRFRASVQPLLLLFTGRGLAVISGGLWRSIPEVA